MYFNQILSPYLSKQRQQLKRQLLGFRLLVITETLVIFYACLPFLVAVFGFHFLLFFILLYFVVLRWVTFVRPVARKIESLPILAKTLERKYSDFSGRLLLACDSEPIAPFFKKKLGEKLTTAGKKLSLNDFCNIKQTVTRIFVFLVISISASIIAPELTTTPLTQSARQLSDATIGHYFSNRPAFHKITTTPPPYTQLKPQTYANRFETIKVFPGTLISISSLSPPPLTLVLRAGEAAVAVVYPLQEGAINRLDAQFHILEASQIYLRNNLVNLESHPVTLTLLSDVLPKVKHRNLTKKQSYSDKDHLSIKALSSDDFGLSKVELVYQVNATEIQRETIAIFTLRRRRQHEEVYKWDLTRLPLHSGDRVAFWIEATDNRTIQGPGIGKSKRETITIEGTYDKHLALFDELDTLKGIFVDNLADVLMLTEKALSPHQIVSNIGSALEGLQILLHKMTADVLSENFLLSRLKSQTVSFQRHYQQLQNALKLNTEPDFTPSVSAHENLIFLMHDIAQNQQTANMINRAEDFFSAFQKLEKLIADYKKNPSPQLKEKIKKAISELKSFLQQMNQSMQKKYQEMPMQSSNAQALERLKEQKLSKVLDSLEDSLDKSSIANIEKQMNQLMDDYTRSLQQMRSDVTQSNQRQYEDMLSQYNKAMQNLQQAKSIQDKIVREAQEIDHENDTNTIRNSMQALQQREQQVDKKLSELEKQVDGLAGSLLNVDELKSIGKRARSQIKQTASSLKGHKFKQTQQQMQGIKRNIDHMQQKLQKLGQNMQQFLKSGGGGKNRNPSGRYGNAIISEKISLEHHFEIDKRYREDIINSMQERFPQSKKIDIEQYYKSILK